MKQRYIYISLVAGLSAPLLVTFMLQELVGRAPYMRGVFRTYFENEGTAVFGLGLPLIPFAALLVLMWWISLYIKETRRLDCIFWGGLIAVWGFTVWAHCSVWYPLYAGQRVSSTMAVAFLFIPFYALVPLAIGLLIGYGVSFLPPFKEGKPPARKEGEDGWVL